MKITVYHSPCGGVGKSSIALAKAMKCAKQGKSVLLVDMATYGSINFMLRDSNLKSGLNRVSALFYDDPNDVSTDDLHDQLNNTGIKPYKEIKNLHTLYAANPVRMDKLDYAHVIKLVEVLKSLDYEDVVIDTSSDLHVRNVALLEMADEIHLIATPDLQCIWHLGNFKDMLNDLYIDIDKLVGVLNKYRPYSSFNIKESEEHFGVKFAYTIPYRGMKWVEIGNHILRKEHVSKGKHYREIQKAIGEKL